MGNISHHFRSLEALLRNMSKLLSMNFHPHIHEKVLIAGSKKHRHRIRMVQNQKMGTIKLPKLGSKKRENTKAHMEGFSPKNTRIPNKNYLEIVLEG